jgi:hypothetical protein
MSRTASFLSRLLWGLSLVLCLSRCGDEITVTRTQLTLRIDASPEVQDALAKLRVTVRVGNQGEREARTEFARSELLGWPVDVQVLPQDNDRSELVEFIVDVLDENGTALVEHRALTSFDPRSKRVLAFKLERCGAQPLGELCSPDAQCRREQCLTCSSQMCVPVAYQDPTPLPPPSPPPTPTPVVPTPTPVVPTPTPVVPTPTPVVPTPTPVVPTPTPVVPASTPVVPTPVDPTPVDAGRDASPDDAGIDAAPVVEAGPDPVPVVDAGPDAMPPGPVPAVPPVSCAVDANWADASSDSAIPAGTKALSSVMLGLEPHDQYLCRARTPDGTHQEPGKVNGALNTQSQFTFGCYFAVQQGGVWSAPPDGAAMFQVLRAPEGCKLEWQSPVPWPAQAVVVSRDAGAQPIYACVVNVTGRSESSGPHIGRVSGLGDLCRLQFFGGLIESASYQVLVQSAP